MLSRVYDPGAQWSESALRDLNVQLTRAGYAGVATVESAELVGNLLRDVLKGAKYGKSAHHLIETRNKQIDDLKKEIAQLREEPPAVMPHEELRKKLYRLLHVSQTCLQMVESSCAARENLKPQTLTLLKLLIDMEATTSDKVPTEFSDYWKLVAERDQLKDELAAKDNIIADLLSGRDVKLMTTCKHLESLEVDLVKRVTELKELLVNEENTKYAKEKKELEAKLLHVEKTFAAHLKTCARTQEFTELDKAPVQSKQLFELIDTQQAEISELKLQISRLEVENAQVTRQIAQNETAQAKLLEDHEALSRRCELFHQEFQDLDSERIELRKQLDLANADVSAKRELEQQLEKVQAELETAQMSYFAADRALSDVREEVTSLRLQLSRQSQLRNSLEGEAAELREANERMARTTEALNREVKNKIRTKDVEINNLQADLELKEAALKKAQDKLVQTEQDKKVAQDSEDAALIDRDEAIKSLDHCKTALKECKRNLARCTEELNELKSRNRFLVTQLAARMESGAEEESVMSASVHGSTNENENIEGIIEGLRLENRLLNEKLASQHIMLQKTIAARKEAQSIAASEAEAAAQFKCMLDDLQTSTDSHLKFPLPPYTVNNTPDFSLGRGSDDAPSTNRQDEGISLLQMRFADRNRISPVPSPQPSSLPSLPSLSAPTISSVGNSISSSFLRPTPSSGAETGSLTRPLSRAQTSSQDDDTYTFASSLPVPYMRRYTPSSSPTQHTNTTFDAISSLQTSSPKSSAYDASSKKQSVTPSGTPREPTSAVNDWTTGIGPTPVPVERGTGAVTQSTGASLSHSFTQRAMERIQKIIGEVADTERADATPRRNQAEEKPPELTAALTTMPSEEDDSKGYYWSPPGPPPEDESSVSAGSLTYSITNHSWTDEQVTTRSRMMLKDWITDAEDSLARVDRTKESRQ